MKLFSETSPTDHFFFLDFSLISPSAPFGNNPRRDLPGLYCRADLFKPLVKPADVMVILNLWLLSVSSPHLHLSCNINSRTEDKASTCLVPNVCFLQRFFFYFPFYYIFHRVNVTRAKRHEASVCEPDEVFQAGCQVDRVTHTVRSFVCQCSSLNPSVH